MISATILNILDLKELEGVWKPKVEFQMEWFDSRLIMQNLKDDIQLNVLAEEEREDPWRPVIIFFNNNESKRFLLDEKATMLVRKVEEYGKNSKTDLDAAMLSYGSDNPFIYGRTYSIELECDFNLRYYPFDTQECFIELGVPVALESKVELEADDIMFNGTTDLPQFQVQSALVDTIDGRAFFIVIFKRKFAYHIVSVYIPSLSLLAVSLATLHISIDHFEANIMVHLTAMLVMYTLFQAISISLPKVKCRANRISDNFSSDLLDSLYKVHGCLASLWSGSAFCWVCTFNCGGTGAPRGSGWHWNISIHYSQAFQAN